MCTTRACVIWESTHSLLFHAEGNGFGESAYAVHWDPDHPPVGKYLCYKSYQLEIVLVLKQLIVCYFLTNSVSCLWKNDFSFDNTIYLGTLLQ